MKRVAARGAAAPALLLLPLPLRVCAFFFPERGWPNAPAARVSACPQVGYWDCTTAIPVGNTTAGNEGSTAGFQNFASLFGSATDMMKFGGQARCPECRCMKSSLMELTRTVTPTFSVYGLCYRTCVAAHKPASGDTTHQMRRRALMHANAVAHPLCPLFP